MKNIVIEYFNILSYTITGLVFGLASFILLINVFHYNSVNEIYVKQDSDYEINDKLKEKLTVINSNIQKIPSRANPNFIDYSNIQTKLNICVQKINTKELNNIFNKDKITMSDVYDIQQFYKINISNECLIKELNTLITDDNSSLNNIASFKTIKPFIEDNINSLKDSSDYIEKVIKSNSDYSFSSNVVKVSIFNGVQDSYYELIKEYNNAINFIYDLSKWYNSEVI